MACLLPRRQIHVRLLPPSFLPRQTLYAAHPEYFPSAFVWTSGGILCTHLPPRYLCTTTSFTLSGSGDHVTTVSHRGSAALTSLPPGDATKARQWVSHVLQAICVLGLHGLGPEELVEVPLR